jgi:hypothetical protein
MSTRNTLDKELIVRRVADRHPSHAQNTPSTSLLTTHNNITARFLRERWECQCALYMTALADALALFKRRARVHVL